MDIIITFIVCTGMGYLIAKSFSIASESKSNVVRLDDKNWIVTNEFVSFEEDTPILRLKQKMEDDEIYRNYEIDRLTHERSCIFNDWETTVRAIRDYPHLKECVTEEKLNAIAEKYDHYLDKCKKLKIIIFFR